MRGALWHPFGIMLLLASLVLAGLVLSVLDRWSGQALWIVLLGLLAYAATIAVLHRQPTVREHSSGSEETGPDPTEDVHAELDSLGLRNIVQQALQKLDNQAALIQYELLPLLSGSLAPKRPQGTGVGVPGELTPLEKAQALREVLIAAIERLKPPGERAGAGAPEAVQYHILHEAYAQSGSVAYIITRHSISESTYHKRRRAAIDAVGHHILAQEKLIGAGGAKAAETA